MDVATIVNDLHDAAIRLHVDGDVLFAEPREGLTDAMRALIRGNRTQLIEVINAASTDITAEYRASLRAGTLVLCRTCRHFAARPGRHPDGECDQHGPVWSSVPFDCRGYIRRKSGAGP